VLEVGAGTGVLTAELAKVVRAVIAVELDPALFAGLRRRFAGSPNVTLLHGDALRVALPPEPFRVVANVPFNASTAILQRLLDPRLPLERADLVLQWEVARKRAGRPRSAVSAAWAPWWRFRLGRRIPPEAFRPRPAVAAAVLVAERRREPLLPPESFDEYGAFVRSLYDGSLVRGLDGAGWAAAFGAWGSSQTRSRPT
jgi:23S rRNA (adenine-N6)-dimethyltransferase